MSKPDPRPVKAVPSPVEELGSDDRIAELELQLEAAQSEREAMSKHYSNRVIDLSQARERIAELEAMVLSIVPGKVISERDGMEVVVVERKKRARPTGRIVPKANIRFCVAERSARELLRSEGAQLNPEGDASVHHVMLRPAPEGREPKAYTVPEDVMRQVIASGAAVEELQ